MHDLGMQTLFMNYKCSVQVCFSYHVTVVAAFIKGNAVYSAHG